jgi:branched-chain amino acid transport system substrate-binding protein
VREWVAAYKAKFSEDPERVLGLRAGRIINMFGIAATRPARSLNPGHAQQGRSNRPSSRPTCSAPTRTPSRRPSILGSDRAMLCQIQDGRWKSVSEYLTN